MFVMILQNFGWFWFKDVLLYWCCCAAFVRLAIFYMIYWGGCPLVHHLFEFDVFGDVNMHILVIYILLQPLFWWCKMHHLLKMRLTSSKLFRWTLLILESMPCRSWLTCQLSSGQTNVNAKLCLCNIIYGPFGLIMYDQAINFWLCTIICRPSKGPNINLCLIFFLLNRAINFATSIHEAVVLFYDIFVATTLFFATTGDVFLLHPFTRPWCFKRGDEEDFATTVFKFEDPTLIHVKPEH